MEDFNHGVEDNLERRCAVCATPLTQTEILASREAGGPFLCSVHADEQVPAPGEAVEDPAKQP